MTKRKRILSVIMAVAMVASMMFAMTANTYAATDAGTATYTVKIYDEKTGTSTVVDTSADSGITFTAGQSLYDAVRTDLYFYEPKWISYLDYYDKTQTVYHMNSFMYYDERNVDHFYASDGSGWSKDWGWMYTVNGKQPVFSDNPDHGKMMNQYIIQPGDEIILKYVYTETAWDSTGKTIYNIVHE